ncbi:MAG: hypothetical protein ACUVSD_04835 [Thiobacillaceae bacterium]
MEVASVAASMLAIEQAVAANGLQLALLKRNMEVQTEALLKVLETAARSGGNPPHLGNLIDTTA